MRSVSDLSGDHAVDKSIDLLSQENNYFEYRLDEEVGFDDFPSYFFNLIAWNNRNEKTYLVYVGSQKKICCLVCDPLKNEKDVVIALRGFNNVLKTSQPAGKSNDFFVLTPNLSAQYKYLTGDAYRICSEVTVELVNFQKIPLQYFPILDYLYIKMHEVLIYKVQDLEQLQSHVNALIKNPKNSYSTYIGCVFGGKIYGILLEADGDTYCACRTFKKVLRLDYHIDTNHVFAFHYENTRYDPDCLEPLWYEINDGVLQPRKFEESERTVLNSIIEQANRQQNNNSNNPSSAGARVSVIHEQKSSTATLDVFQESNNVFHLKCLCALEIAALALLITSGGAAFYFGAKVAGSLMAGSGALVAAHMFASCKSSPSDLTRDPPSRSYSPS